MFLLGRDMFLLGRDMFLLGRDMFILKYLKIHFFSPRLCKRWSTATCAPRKWTIVDPFTFPTGTTPRNTSHAFCFVLTAAIACAIFSAVGTGFAFEKFMDIREFQQAPVRRRNDFRTQKKTCDYFKRTIPTMDESVTTSIAALYRASANPLRVNPDKVRTIEQTPFVRSRDGGSRQSQNNVFRKSQHSRRSQSDERSRRSERDAEETRVSRREEETRASRSDRGSDRDNQSRSRKSRSEQQEEEQQQERDHERMYRERLAQAEFESQVNRGDIQKEKNDEKAMYLHEMNRFRRGGTNVPRDMTMDNSLGDIECEFNRLKQSEDQASTVNFMKGVIKLACTGLELGNSKLKLLRLNDWSKEACGDMSRFDRPLNRLYARYWRRGSINPFLELGFLVFGSMIIHHFKNLMFPQSSPSPAQNTTVPPPSRNVPFNIPFQQQQQQQQPPRRPTMQPPSQSTSIPFNVPFQGQRMPPPRQQMMPPRQQMMPPQQQMMPPRQQMMPPRQQMMPPVQRPTMKPPSAQPFMAKDIEIDFQNKTAKRSSKPQIEIVVENENVGGEDAQNLSQSPTQLVDDDDLNLEDLLDSAV